MRAMADLIVVELEQAARVIALRGEAWARAIAPGRPPDISGMPALELVSCSDAAGYATGGTRPAVRLSGP
jgi:hypothetical protein